MIQIAVYAKIYSKNKLRRSKRVDLLLNIILKSPFKADFVQTNERVLNVYIKFLYIIVGSVRKF